MTAVGAAGTPGEAAVGHQPAPTAALGRTGSVIYFINQIILYTGLSAIYHYGDPRIARRLRN